MERAYGDHTHRILGELGIADGAKVVDIGCGTGSITKWLASAVGAAGRVVAVDRSAEQLTLLSEDIDRDSIGNVTVTQADAMQIELARGEFDLAHCRLLISHTAEPVAVVREMAALVKPGGLVVSFEIDINGLTSFPRTEIYDRFRQLSRNSGQAMGLEFEIGTKLPAVFRSAGLAAPDMEFIEPVYLRGEEKRFWEYTARESKLPVQTGLMPEETFSELMHELETVANSELYAVAQPRLVACWARKAANPGPMTEQQ